MPREGYQPHQPPAALHAPALGGQYFGPQNIPLTPPSVQSVQHVYTPGGNVGSTPWHQNVKEGFRVKSPPYSLHQRPGKRNDKVLGVEPGT